MLNRELSKVGIFSMQQLGASQYILYLLVYKMILNIR